MAQPEFRGGNTGARPREWIEAMPSVLRIGAFRFFFYSNENAEPPHIHIRAAESEAKFWLESIALVWNKGFNKRELRRIERHIADNHESLLEAWQEFFGE